MRTIIKAWMSSNLGRIPPLTSELVALERLKKISYNPVSTLAPSALIGSSSYLEVKCYICICTCILGGWLILQIKE